MLLSVSSPSCILEPPLSLRCSSCFNGEYLEMCFVFLPFFLVAAYRSLIAYVAAENAMWYVLLHALFYAIRHYMINLRTITSPYPQIAIIKDHCLTLEYSRSSSRIFTHLSQLICKSDLHILKKMVIFLKCIIKWRMTWNEEWRRMYHFAF